VARRAIGAGLSCWIPISRKTVYFKNRYFCRFHRSKKRSLISGVFQSAQQQVVIIAPFDFIIIILDFIVLDF
jgi:hypothetical protein